MQNRIVFLCAILFALVTTTIAQEHQLDLKTGKVLLDPENSLAKLSAITPLSLENRPSGTLVLGISNGSVPVQTELVEPLQFISRRAYYVWVSARSKPADWSAANIQEIYELKPAWKLDPALSEPVTLDWAVEGELISVRAMTFFDPSDQSILASLTDRSYEVLEIDGLIRSVTVKIPISDLSNLADLPWVYWIEPITPPLEINNLVERTNHRVPALEKGAGLYDLSGKGVVVGEWDGGGAQKRSILSGAFEPYC